jgi:hypothetical protein
VLGAFLSILRGMDLTHLTDTQCRDLLQQIADSLHASATARPLDSWSGDDASNIASILFDADVVV